MLYRFLDFELDPTRFQLRQGGKPVPIPRQVFDLILFLARNHERPVTRNELVSHVWGGRSISDSSLSRCLFLARKALGDTPRQHRFIKTIHGRGYWFVAPVEVVVERAGGEGGREGQGVAPAFVGREIEVDAAVEAIRSVALGACKALLAVGEPGIGKSRFLAEVGRAASREGLFVATGSCGEVAGSAPARGWAQVLGSLWGYFGDQVGQPHHAEGLARFGVFAARDSIGGINWRGADLPFERARALDACSSFVQGCCRVLPTAILIDDLHRADETSLDLLSLVISDAADHQLLVVGTARDPDPDRDSPAPKVFDLSANSQVSILPLSRFDAEEVERFVRDVGGAGLLGETSRLLERSGGNPFYLRQLVSVLRGRAGASVEMLQLPQTMREAVLAHLGSLAPELVETLQVASVIGRDFPEDLLAAVLEASIERVQELLESAAHRGIVEYTSPGSYKFEHVLVQEALYSMLPRVECGRAHLRVAEALDLQSKQASGPGEASAIAHHRHSALPNGSVEEAIDAAVTAARLAYRVFALDQAAGHCRVALSLLAGSERRDLRRELEIRLELSKALLGSGLREEGRACLSEAARLAVEAEAGDRIAEIALSVAPGFLSIETGVVDEFLVDRLESALELEDLHPSTRGRLTARLALALYWSPDSDPRDLLMSRAESLAELGRDEHVEAVVAVYGTAARWSPATFGERLRSLADLGVAATASGDRSVELLAAVLRVTTLMEAGKIGAADRGIAQLSQLVDDSGDPLARWYPIAMTAMRNLLAGRYDEATRQVARYSQLAKRFGDSNVDQTALMQLGEAAWQAGHAESVLDLVRSQADRVRATPEWRCALALVLALSGRYSASVAEARSVLADFALLSERINGSIGWAALAMACSLSRNESLVADLYDWGAGLGSATIVGGYGMLCWGSREFFLGVLAGSCGDLGKGEQHLLAAVEGNTRFGSPPWIAHARFALSELYERRDGRGDSERSLVHAAEARALSLGSGIQLNSFVRGRAVKG